MPLTGQTFKLQYAGKGAGTCDSPANGSPATYTDVSPSSGFLRFADTPTPTDGANLTANANDPTHGADTRITQTYEEANSFTNAVAAIAAGNDGEWDFVLTLDSSVPGYTDYCLRAIRANLSLLETFSVYPEVISVGQGNARLEGVRLERLKLD